MASIPDTAFEVSVSNISRNNTQNVAGKFGTGTGTTFKSEICPSGMLCVQGALLPDEGYEKLGPSGANILNGNTWEFVAAATGAAAPMIGDHTGIYAFNSYDVRQVSDGPNVWRLGANFLGLELPADMTGDFTEIIIGEQYTFGAGNFSTLPSGAGAIYATIANGRLVASSTKPADGSGVYFTILRSKAFSVGARYAGFNGYVCRAMRAPEEKGGDTDVKS